jgi:ribosomal protein S24E
MNNTVTQQDALNGLDGLKMKQKIVVAQYLNTYYGRYTGMLLFTVYRNIQYLKKKNCA